MKKTASLLICAVILLLTAVPAFAQDYSCTLKVTENATKTGDVISVDVVISEGMSGIDVNVTFDTQKFEFVEGKATNLMVVMPNLKGVQSGIVHIAAVSTQATEAGTVYTMKLKVLDTDGVLKTHVNEALDAEDNDVSSLIKDSTVSIRVSGTRIYAEKISGPIPTTASGNDTKSNSNSNSVPSADSSVKPSAPEASSEDISNTVTSSQNSKTDSEEAENEAQSKRGLITAAAVGVLALAGVIAILIASNAKKKGKAENNSQQNPEKK